MVFWKKNFLNLFFNHYRTEIETEIISRVGKKKKEPQKIR